MPLIRFNFGRKMIPSSSITAWGKSAKSLGSGIKTTSKITELRRKQHIARAGLRSEERRGFRQSPQMVKTYNEQIGEFESKISALKKAKEKTQNQLF